MKHESSRHRRWCMLSAQKIWRAQMRRKRFLWSATTVAAVVVLGLCSVAWAAQAAKVDVTGAWTFTVESAAGSSTPAVTFKQEGEKLTGHYSSALLGEAELTGTVKGQTI